MLFQEGTWHADIPHLQIKPVKLYFAAELMRYTWRWHAAESGDQYRIGKKFFQ